MVVARSVQLVGTLQCSQFEVNQDAFLPRFEGEIVITFVSVFGCNILLLFEHVRKFCCCARIGA